MDKDTEIKEEETTNTPLNEESALLKAYKELKANSVSKEVYDRDISALKEKNDIYIKAITEGGSVDVPTEDSISINDAINQVSKFRGTNLEYWDKMTTAIDKTLQALPDAEITKITGSDGLDEIIKVNETMKQMVKDANGDSDYFRTLYKNRVNDSAPRISADIEKAGGLVNYFNQNQK